MRAPLSFLFLEHVFGWARQHGFQRVAQQVYEQARRESDSVSMPRAICRSSDLPLVASATSVRFRRARRNWVKSPHGPRAREVTNQLPASVVLVIAYADRVIANYRS